MAYAFLCIAARKVATNRQWGTRWTLLLDTVHGWVDAAAPLDAGARLSVAARSVVLLQRQA